MSFYENINFQFYVIAYLAGGIPFGAILAHLFAGVDIKSEGSGSIGATNVLRVVSRNNPALGRKLAAGTLLLDGLKGVVILLIAHFGFGLSEAALWGIAVLAVLGHCFSIFLFFEGGRGVATGLGVMAFMLPEEALIGLGVWGVLFFTTRISSISSLGGVAALLGASFYLHPDMAHAPVVIIAGVLLYKHIPNLVRLFTGEEKPVV